MSARKWQQRVLATHDHRELLIGAALLVERDAVAWHHRPMPATEDVALQDVVTAEEVRYAADARHDLPTFEVVLVRQEDRLDCQVSAVKGDVTQRARTNFSQPLK